MKKTIFLAFKDFRVLFSDKGNIFWVFVFPALFALFFGAIYSGIGKEPSGMKIAIVNEDQSEFSNSYISQLRSYGALKIVQLGREEAIDGIRKGKFSAAVIIKEGFGSGLETMFAGKEPMLEIASDPSRKMEGLYLQGLLAKAQFEILGEKFTDRNWMRSQVGRWRTEVEDANNLDKVQAKLYLAFFDSFDTLLKDVNDENFQAGFKENMINFAESDVIREREGPVTSFQITFPQAVIWGILGCAATFAISIVQERVKGTFERLRVGPIGRAHILAGKGLACLITCVSMACFLYIVAKVIFKMPMRSLPLFIIATLCAILCFVGFMMFISTLGRTEQSASGAGWAMLMVMAMLGGGMVPLVFMPSWLRPFSNISPVKWSIFALEGGIWRNLSFVEMLTPFLVLLAIGTAFFLLGVFMLHRQDK